MPTRVQGTASQERMEKFDCVVIGAGWYGLGAAKQYHCLCPESTLAVFDGQSTLGGTWAESRLYPGLKSNNLWGSYEYPDFPMDTESFGVKKDEYVPSTVIHQYMKAYAHKFGITDLIRLNSKVEVAEHQKTAEGGWRLSISRNGQESYVFARRIILATGLTSQPFIPHIEGQETYGGKIFHGKHFQQNKDTIQQGNTVTVFGGTKFAWDAVYAYASAGVQVDWIIRKSGHGPCWTSPSYVTPLKRWIEELANTRFLTWFSPCIWGDSDGYTGTRRFLHGTALGRFLVNMYWAILGGDVMSLMKYDSHPDTAKLKPWMPAMFTATSFSIYNFDTDFFKLVRSDLVKVHIGNIDHLSPGKVHLADGTELKSDSLLSHTGWKHVPLVKFLPEGIDKELGLPHQPELNAPPEDLANQQSLLAKADQEILEKFPRLKDQPIWNRNYMPITDAKAFSCDKNEVTPCKPMTPYMLHRFMVPPSESLLRTRDFAVVGAVSNFSNVITAHVQGLWLAAYFSGRLASDPANAVGHAQAMEELRYQTVLTNRFGKWRYPTDAGKNPSFIFDAVPYLDQLQRDLGLEIHRKGGAWAEMWSPYLPRDYECVNDLWLEKNASKIHSSEPDALQ